MRVTIFARVDTGLNPYVLLFKNTLERQGLTVRLESEFNLEWLLARSRSCDCIHLQWIDSAYSVSSRTLRSPVYRKLMNHRLFSFFTRITQLMNFSLTLLFAKIQGKTIVFTVHDLEKYGEKSFYQKMLRRIAHHLVFLLSDHVHVHNFYTRKSLEIEYRRKNAVHVIPHGNYIGYYPNRISKSDARKQLDVPEGSFVYLFLGLIRPYKGLEELFSAFKKLDGPNARLLVAGRVFGVDGYEIRLKEIIRNDSRIKLIPEFVPDEALQTYFNACDVFVLPYRHITTSGAAALALSFGRPIIAPDITSFQEVITRETGILYNPSQADALLSSLREAGNRSWSEAEIYSCAHQFDWDKLGPRLAALYRKGSEIR